MILVFGDSIGTLSLSHLELINISICGILHGLRINNDVVTNTASCFLLHVPLLRYYVIFVTESSPTWLGRTQRRIKGGRDPMASHDKVHSKWLAGSCSILDRSLVSLSINASCSDQHSLSIPAPVESTFSTAGLHTRKAKSTVWLPLRKRSSFYPK
jgi:hypothetical protein